MEGTLARRLMDTPMSEVVTLQHKKVPLRASIHTVQFEGKPEVFTIPSPSLLDLLGFLSAC